MISSGLLGMLTRIGAARPYAAGGGTFWMPVRASESAGAVDHLFYFIFWISLFFFTLIMALMVVFAIRYRRRREGELPEPSPSHNLPVEIVWTAIPVLVVAAIFWFGFRTYMDMDTAPANAYQIQVTGQKWKWTFTYPNGYVDELLYVPADRPVQLTLTSEDVIHSFYVPAFRIKRDAVPGRYSKAWFTADRPGDYDLYCAEYCGAGHSAMISTVKVLPPAEFDAWLQAHSDILSGLTPVEGGERVYNVMGCKQCHSLDGSPGVGPTFRHVFGETVKFRDGSSAVVDENYVRESVLDPTAKIVMGFEPVMPTFKGRISDAQITAVIAFLKSLSGEAPQDTSAAAGGAADDAGGGTK